MPKVRLKVSMAAANFSYVPGDEIEVHDDAAKAWVEADIAELVEEPKPKKAALKKAVDK